MSQYIAEGGQKLRKGSHVKRAQDNLISNAECIVLRVLLFNHVLNMGGFKHGWIQKLTDHLHQHADKVEKNIWSVRRDAVKDFMVNLSRPTSEKAALYESFLISHGFLKKGQMENFAAAFDSIKEYDEIMDLSEKDSDDLKKIEGMYLYESSADSETLFSFIIIAMDNKHPFLTAYVAEKVYKPEYCSDADAYQRRIDNGECDIFREFNGKIVKINEFYLLELMNYSSKRIAEMRKAYIKIDDSDITENLIVTYSKDNISRKFESVGEWHKIIKKLTKRQLNNIHIERKRGVIIVPQNMHLLLLYNDHNSLRGKGKKILSEFDEQLLDSAESGNTGGMILALVNGANINAQDPDTGFTALHYVAKNADLVSLKVLIYDPDALTMFYDLMQDEELKGIKDFDSKLRKAQIELDTLVLSHDHRFAIEQCRFPHSFHQIHNNPYLQIDEQVYDAIAIVQKEQLLFSGRK